nr:hypothetical protein CFP56_56929 [Quercus suber]
MCASDDFSCLCSQYSSEGFTLGELTYGCLYVACDQQTVADQFETYDICDAAVNAVAATHAQSIVLPSTTASSVLSSVTAPPSTSSPNASTTTTLSSTRTITDNSELQISTSTSLASYGTTGAASSTIPSASSIAFTQSSSSGLNKAQAVGVSVAVFGTILLIIAIAFFVTLIRRRKRPKRLHRSWKRHSYDFIDDAPANISTSPDSRSVDDKQAYRPFNVPDASHGSSENGYTQGYSTIHPVPRSIGSEKQKLDLNPFADYALAQPPTLTINPASFPPSEHNSMLLPEKPGSVDPPPQSNRTYLAPPRSESVTNLGKDKSQTPMANFSRPALPAQPKEVFLPSNPKAKRAQPREVYLPPNPKAKMAQPPALVRRELPQQQTGPIPGQPKGSAYQVSARGPAHQYPQHALDVTASPESTRKLSLSLDIPRQAKGNISGSPPVQVFPAAPARGDTTLRIVNRTPSPIISTLQRNSQQDVHRPLQTEGSVPRSSAMSAYAPWTAQSVSRPQPRASASSTSLTRSRNSATTDIVLSYYTAPIASHESPPSTTITTPVEEVAQCRRAVPMAITVTRPTHPPRTARSNARNSSGSDTSFESNDADEPTPPDVDASHTKSPSPVQELQVHYPQQSPIAAIRYPKIPRASNQIVSRSPGGVERAGDNDRLSQRYTSPIISAGLAGLIEQSNQSPQQVRIETTPDQGRIDTSTLSGSTLGIKRRDDGEAKGLTVDTSYSRLDVKRKAESRSGSDGKREDDKALSARNIAQRESPLKGYKWRTSMSGNGGERRRTLHGAIHERPPRNGGPPYSAGVKQFPPSAYGQPKQRRVPPALMIGNGFRPARDEVVAEHDTVLKSPLLQLWGPKLIPRRQGEDLFLEVSLAAD